MSNPFASLETNLGRAASAYILTALFAAALTQILGAVGFNRDLGLLVLLAGFPMAAWFLSRAAIALGRSPLIYGLAGLVPPIAVYAFIRLYSRDQDVRLARKFAVGQDA
tara:strand:+ start:3374 stop:3700 length:327 start_codon:yes stop_codon:yes gene_type:complete